MCSLYEVWEMCPQICVVYTKYGRCARKYVWFIRSMGDVLANMCGLYEVWGSGRNMVKLKERGNE